MIAGAFLAPFMPGEVVAVYVQPLLRWRRADVIHSSFGSVTVLARGRLLMRVPATPKWVRRMRVISLCAPSASRGVA